MALHFVIFDNNWMKNGRAFQHWRVALCARMCVWACGGVRACACMCVCVCTQRWLGEIARVVSKTFSQKNEITQKIDQKWWFIGAGCCWATAPEWHGVLIPKRFQSWWWGWFYKTFYDSGSIPAFSKKILPMGTRWCRKDWKNTCCEEFSGLNSLLTNFKMQ